MLPVISIFRNSHDHRRTSRTCFPYTTRTSEALFSARRLVPELKRRVEEYKLMLPVISNLRNKALKDRHWERIEAELGQPIDVEGDLTLGSLLDMHVTSHKDVIATVSTEATQV